MVSKVAMNIDVCCISISCLSDHIPLSEFGDLTKTAVSKVGTGVADAVQDFTGKEQYEL